jgi:hypothetical protein
MYAAYSFHFNIPSPQYYNLLRYNIMSVLMLKIAINQAQKTEKVVISSAEHVGIDVQFVSESEVTIPILLRHQASTRKRHPNLAMTKLRFMALLALLNPNPLPLRQED